MIAFNCPGCNHRLTVNDEHAGKRGTCPQCKKPVLVPTLTPAAVSARPAVPAPPSAPTVANPPPLADAVTASSPEDDTPSSSDVGAPKLDFLSPPQKPDELGRLGSYRVLKVLGAGGMGMVLLAEDPALKRAVAIKVMRPEFAKEKIARQRFLREAQATAAIEHHHIIPIHQVAEEKGVPFIVMPLLKGEPLDSRLKREKRMSVADTVLIGKQIAEGLAEAHKNGLVHRDIKPANIWLSGEAGASASTLTVKIVDFGLARGVAGDDVHLTKTGTILGTPAYMAPEQAKSEKVDFRCDLFSLGAVLYRMLSGELPFKGFDTTSLLMALATDTPKPVQSLNPEVPPALADLVMQLLAKEPAQRPPSAKMVAETLGEIGGVKTVMLSVSPRPHAQGRGVGGEGMGRRLAKRSGALLWSLRPWAFRRPGLAFAIEGTVLALLVLLLALPFMGQKAEVTKPERPEDKGPPKEYTNSLKMKFRLIPAGKFTMGSPKEEIDRYLELFEDGTWQKERLPTEGPEHQVEISQPFYLGTTEVTVGQFRQFVTANPKYSVDERWQKPGFDQNDDHPVVFVTWNDAVAFCEWLSDKEGKKYRLPTEAEWEYSCRAGKSGTSFCYGNSEATLGEYGWFNGNSEGKTHPVGKLKANEWGLYDMHGNAWEWCQDSYDPNYYKNSPKQDPAGGAGGERVLRGGSWSNAPVVCRSAFRGHVAPDYRHFNLGFRVLLVPSSLGGARP